MRSTTDAFDDLAALFLTDDDRPIAGDRALPAVQLVIAGHLPVMAGLWLAQYADMVGRSHGPAALVRFDETEASLEVLRAGGRRVGIDGAPTLREAIRGAARFVERWIVRPDPRLPLASLLDAGVEPITLLTGADEAALVAAYRAIKELVEAAAARGDEVPSIEVCVLGASPERAEAVVEKLRRTASTFLNVELPLVGTLQRMEPIESAGQVAFPRSSSAITAPPALGEVIDWIHEASEESGARLDREAAPPRVALVRDDELDHERPDPAAAERPTSTPARPEPVIEAPRPLEAPQGDRREPVAPHGAVGEADSLAAAVGLHVLPLRCPEHPRVEMAVDEAGRLQLVAAVAQVDALLGAEAWAQRNRPLLALAFREALRDPAPPRLHAVASAPLEAASLQGGRIQLHLRAAVRTPASVSWYVAPLNRVGDA